MTLGTATLSGGVATLVSSAAPTGEGVVTATYSGDSNDPAGVSAALGLKVSQAATTVALTSSAAPAAFGQWVQFTATVAPVSPGAGTPTGLVTFTDGKTTIGTAPLVNGMATLATTSLGIGGHSITATYGGDANDVGAASSAISQSVQKATTSTVLKSRGGPVVGQAITFTATIRTAQPGSATPTGTVTFYDGTAVLGAVPSLGGVATLTTSALTVGKHSITAVYNGDANTAASATSRLTQSVAQSPTITTLTGSVSTPTPGQKVVLTATVAAASPGSGAPTGVVVFTDGKTTLGSAQVVGGRASLSVSFSGVGSTHVVIATYSGDKNFLGSKAPSLKETVTQPSTIKPVVTPAPIGRPAAHETKIAAGVLVVTEGAKAVTTSEGKKPLHQSATVAPPTVRIPTVLTGFKTYKVLYSY